MNHVYALRNRFALICIKFSDFCAEKPPESRFSTHVGNLLNENSILIW